MATVTLRRIVSRTAMFYSHNAFDVAVHIDAFLLILLPFACDTGSHVVKWFPRGANFPAREDENKREQ
jgi:hypothetical protein